LRRDFFIAPLWRERMSDFFVISGCSGGGKSSLLAELARRDFATIEEPGRRVVREELASGGEALPWIDGIAFARRITALARQDHDAARTLSGPVFFDRGLIDAAVAQMKVASPEERRDQQFRTLLNNISDGTANAMTGVLHTLALDGLPDDWLLLRTVALLDIAPRAAKFMAPDDRNQLKNAAVEAAGLIKNPDVRSGVNTVARAFEMLQQ